MRFFDAVRLRRSVRRFTSQEVREELLLQVIEAAAQAPSAGNLQAYEIHIVREQASRRRLDVATGSQGAVAAAPVALVFCAAPQRSSQRYGAKGEQLFCIQDATIACAYAQLAATALGLASVWIGAVQEPEVIKELLGLEEGLWPIAVLPIGHAGEDPSPKPRRALSELARGLPMGEL